MFFETKAYEIIKNKSNISYIYSKFSDFLVKAGG